MAVGVGVATPILLAIIVIGLLVTCCMCRVKGWCCCQTVQSGSPLTESPMIDRGSMENLFFMEDETADTNSLDPDLEDQNVKKKIKILFQANLALFVNKTREH